MAHELDFNKRTGKRSFFSVGEDAWHKEGVVLCEAPSLEKAIELAGVDYIVEGRPLYVKLEGRGIKSPMGKAIIRTDREGYLDKCILGIVGEGYQPLQNIEAFGVLEPLLDSGVATLETGGTLREGRDAWMLVKFNINDPVVQEVFSNEVIPYGLFLNNHSGHSKASVMQTPIRVVCANTLAVALRDKTVNISVKHRKNVRMRYIEAAEDFLSKITDRYKHISESYRIMKEKILTVEEFTNSVLNTIAPLPVKPEEGFKDQRNRRLFDTRMNKAEVKRDRLAQAWEGGLGHTGNHSAWEGYNGAIQVIDHEDKYFKVRGSRLESMIDGNISDVKDKLFESVLAICRN